MGTNRKPIEGSQIPELLKLFKEVKQGRKPQDTKHSFCISKEQIETLDPRIAERIRKEVSEKTKEKNAKKCVKLVADLDTKLAGKKISKEMYDDKLWQFYNIVEGQIDNEVAKAIEKAHFYHFNLQNYRSNLSDDKLKDWQETLKGVKPKNGSKIEKRYQELQNAELKIALQILASFGPKDALQMDIAREYLSKLDKKVLEQDEKLQKLEEILRKGFQYPLVELGSLITPKYEKIKKDNFQGDFDVVEKISFVDGKIHLREKRETGMDLYKAETGELITSKINVHQGAMALSPSDLVCSTHYQVYSVNQTEVNLKYLVLVLRSGKFLKIVNIEKAGGIKNEAGTEFLAKFKIPLPPLEVQNEIVEKIEKQKQIVKGAMRIEENFLIDDKYFQNVNECQFRDLFAEPLKNGVNFSKEQVGEGTKFVNVGDLFVPKYINLDRLERVNISAKEIESNKLIDGDILFVRSSVKKEGAGYPAIFSGANENVVFCGFIIRARLNKTKAISEYVNYFLRTLRVRKYLIDDLAPVAITNINQDKIENIKIPLPPLETQRQIVEKLDQQMQALEGVRLLKSEAEKRIEEILAEVWGE
jgi:restriction endonuclease S subunit